MRICLQTATRSPFPADLLALENAPASTATRPNRPPMPAEPNTRRELQKLRTRRVLPWLVFAVGFALTTGVGATIIGLSNGQKWGFDVSRQDMLGLNLDVLTDSVFANEDYWGVLGLGVGGPLVGALFAWLFSPRLTFRVIEPRPLGRILPVARVVYGLIFLWLLARVATLVPDAHQTILGAWRGGDLEEHYRVRYLIMSVLHPKEFGLAYTGLLTLLALPLYNAMITRRSTAAWIELSLWLATYWFMALVLVQKLLISFSLLLVGLALCAASNVLAQWKRLLLILVLFLSLIHFVMAALIPSWTMISTIDHVIGRSADSYPYAMLIAPKHEFGLGQYVVGSVLGGPAFLGETISPNTEIYDLMYPETEGAMAVAAPVWSYVDVGLPGTALTMLLVMSLCGFVTWLSRHATRSPWGWALYLLFSVQIYHLTQIPVLGTLFWGYGAIYGLTVLALVWGLSLGYSPGKSEPSAAS
jgi:hypothetical protein